MAVSLPLSADLFVVFRVRKPQYTQRVSAGSPPSSDDSGAIITYSVWIR